MAENNPPPAAAGAEAPGRPFYEKARQELKDLIRERMKLDRQLAAIEDDIHKRETMYLEETPHGNIITGFDAYTKGTSAAAGAGRRRGGVNDSNRVFSKSSVTFNQNMDSPMPSAQSTPVQAAPTPISTSFLKGESASNHATPTSSTSANRTGAGSKKNKKPVGEDSETDTKEVKKARTGSAATSRK